MIQHSSTKRPNVKLKCLVLGAAAAGKTSLIRRLFYNKFDPSSRVPTAGSDWYTASVDSPLEDLKDVVIGVQIWDTPGRERFDAKRQRQQSRSVADSFLLEADAIMLVYDMTSSTSFKQLLKWFAELVNLERRPPILVCANKLDLYVEQQQLTPNNNPQRPSVVSRDVLGLHGRYRGNDIRYEYQVSRVEEPSTPRDSQKASQQQRRIGIQTYLADRENWTSDGSYLESLLTTEDQSNPDIEMVKLWCLRNGLQHVESSAATGEGVEGAFRELMRLGLVPKVEDGLVAVQVSSAPAPPIEPVLQLQNQQRPQQNAYQYVPRRNKELDFHKRYAPKEERCCLPFLEPVRKFLKSEDEF